MLWDNSRSIIASMASTEYGRVALSGEGRTVLKKVVAEYFKSSASCDMLCDSDPVLERGCHIFVAAILWAAIGYRVFGSRLFTCELSAS